MTPQLRGLLRRGGEGVSSAVTAARWPSSGHACVAHNGQRPWVRARGDDAELSLPSDIAAAPGTGVSKSAVSRRFVALSAE
jgi:hypothetical protein